MNNLGLLKFHVGIDISKSKFDAAVGFIDNMQNSKLIATHVFTNDNDGFFELIKWVSKKTKTNIPVSFSMEATGVYYEKLAYCLNENGFHVHVLVPSITKKYIQSIGIKSKTDKIDAKSLMLLGLERNLKKWEAPNKYYCHLRILTRERESMIKERTQLSNQRHAIISGYNINEDTLKRINKRIEIINEFVKEVELDINKLIKQNSELNEKIKKIITIPGVGILTVATILSETLGFNLIQNVKQLTSYAGYDVVLRDSGQIKSKGKISKKGNSHIRKAMHLPAITSRRSNSNYKAFYDKIYNKKNIKMIGCVALQRKMLCLIYTLWKKDEEFKMIVNSGNYEMEASFGSGVSKKK